jgi:hypothetical protein
MQSTTRWLIGTIGAVAFAVLAGVQLSAIGKLHGHRFDIALLWAVVAIAGILFALGMAARVLASKPISLGALAKVENSRRGSRLKNDPAMAGLKPSDLSKSRKEVAQQVQNCLNELQQEVANRGDNVDVIEPELTQLKDALARVDATVEAVEWLARGKDTRTRFRLSLIGLGVGIALVFVGTLGFLSMTAGAKSTPTAVKCPRLTVAVVAADLDPTPCTPGATITEPKRVTIKLAPAGIIAYETMYHGCVLHIPPNLVGWAIGGTWTDPRVEVTEANKSGQPPCVPKENSSFVLQPNYGSATPRWR